MSPSPERENPNKRQKLSPSPDAGRETPQAETLENSDEAEIKDPVESMAESKKSSSANSPSSNNETVPPLPNEAPPLPEENPPVAEEVEDDGWAPVWEESAQAYYFYNRFTGASQWTNPRVPEPSIPPAPGTTNQPASLTSPPPPTLEKPPAGGYNPAIHGDYDPNAWYAQSSAAEETQGAQAPGTNSDPSAQYAATAAFNRFTGRYQAADLNPENFNDENKSKRQMNAFFDVDAAANNHDGRSLKAERSGKKLTKTELKQFKEKRKAKKEEKRRAWLRD